MPVVYLTTQGAEVQKRGDALVVQKDDQQLAELEVHRIESICIFGRVHLTLPAIELLLARNIETAFLTVTGRLKGQLTPVRPKNVGLRLEQFRRFLQPDIRLAIARRIVQAKLANAAELVQRFVYNHPDAELHQQIDEIRRRQASAGRADNLEVLRGHEGAGSRAYFAALARMCREPFCFSKRTSRPPTDPVNAILSLGYVLLGNELSSLADAIGLDPYLGFYHEPVDGRASLAVDLIEELRHPIVDRFCLYLVNNRILKPDNFETDPERLGGVLLKEEPFRRYLEEYDRWMRRSPRKARPCPRDVVRRQVERFAEWLRGPNQAQQYETYRFED